MKLGNYKSKDITNSDDQSNSENISEKYLFVDINTYSKSSKKKNKENTNIYDENIYKYLKLKLKNNRYPLYNTCSKFSNLENKNDIIYKNIDKKRNYMCFLLVKVWLKKLNLK